MSTPKEGYPVMAACDTIVLCSEFLHAAKSYAMNRRGLIEIQGTKERKTMGKILGPDKDNVEYRRRHDQELYGGHHGRSP